MRGIWPVRAVLWSSLLLGASSCTWISGRLYEERRNALDQDGDGARYDQDCDDRDGTVFPGAPEAPYDGRDSDCDGQDLVDQDGDGFPGLSIEDYQALDPDVPYPEALVGKPLDCADDPARVPDAARVHPDPTGAIEVPYDAIDGDCQGDNDFDVDLDGWMPDVVTIEDVTRPTDQVFAEYLQAWGIDATTLVAPPGHLAPVVGDCDDADIDVHPENTIPDVWYDGVDRDCDHRNDYDQDGDCFMPAAAADGYAEYVERTYGERPPPFCVDPELPFGDCLDAPDPAIRSVPDDRPADPATVHPATDAYANDDAPYDAIDADCAGDNDFDGDRDGYMPSEVPYTPPNGETVTELAQAYAATWGYDAGGWTLVEGDCDDARADSWPGALEVIGDGLDQDCGGDPDRTPWGFGDGTVDYGWTRPTNPELVRLGDTYVLLAGAEEAQAPDLLLEVGVAFPFALDDARNGAAPSEPEPEYWKGASPTQVLQLQPLLDVAVLENPIDVDGDKIPDPQVTAAYSQDNDVTGFTHLNIDKLQVRSVTGQLTRPGGGTTDYVTGQYASVGLDVIHDALGNVFALACAPNWVHTTYSVQPPPVRAEIRGTAAEACFFHGPPDASGDPVTVPFTLCEGGACEAYSATSAPSIEGPDPAPGAWVYGDHDGGWIALIDGAGAATVREVGGADERVFVDRVVHHLDVSAVGSDLYVAAVVEGVGGPEVWLAYGPPGGLMELDLGFDDPSIVGEVPTWVAVHADEDRVAVAVTALTGQPLQDTVGWVFLGP